MALANVAMAMRDNLPLRGSRVYRGTEVATMRAGGMVDQDGDGVPDELAEPEVHTRATASVLFPPLVISANAVKSAEHFRLHWVPGDWMLKTWGADRKWPACF